MINGLWRRASSRLTEESKKLFILRGVRRLFPPTLEHLAPQVEEQLTGMAGQLDAIGSEVESHFLAIAESLDELPAIGCRLVRQSERLLGLASGDETAGKVFQATLAFIGQPLDFIDRCHAETEALLEKIRETDLQIDGLLSAEETLRRTVTPLRFIKILFKVEASRFDSHVQQTFLALTDDIDTLQKQVSETFAAKFDSLRATRATVSKLAEDLILQTRSQRSVVTNKRQKTREALDKLQAALQRNAQRDIQLTQVSRSISSKVGQLVVSLQAQDIVAQKLAHVTAALREAQGKFAEARDQREATNTAGVLHLLKQTSRLESAQLKAIATDLEQTHDLLAGNMDQIRDNITDLNEKCIHLAEFDTITTGADGVVQVLLDNLADLQCLVTDAVANVSRVHEAIRPIGGHASNLTGVMGEMSAQIHLIAINAQVQAAHVGAGTGLEVLAASTARIARETNQVSEQIAGGLDKLTSGLNQLVGKCAELSEQAAAQQETLERERSSREGALHAFRDDALGELARVGEDSDRILNLVAAMRAKVNLKSIADGIVTTARLTLEELSERSGEALDVIGRSEPPDGFVQDLSRRYTMASERAVHEASITGAAQSESATQASGAADKTVDLFEDFGATGRAVTPAASSAQTVPAVSTATTPAISSSSTPAKKDQDLGQNVDLF